MSIMGLHFRSSLQSRIIKDSDEDSSNEELGSEFFNSNLNVFMEQLNLVLQPSKKKHD